MQAFAQIFRTVPVPCLICGKAIGNTSRALVCPVQHRAARSVLRQLCGACSGSIPWIVAPVCRICGRSEACPDCPRREERPIRFSRCAVRYEENMREWLASYKYRGNERLAPLMAAMLACGYERMCSDLNSRNGSLFAHVITSVPLARERLAERSFNQAEQMARQLAEWYRVPYLTLLHRNRNTEKQSLKNRNRRLADMKGTFTADDQALSALADRANRLRMTVRILLVDDIYTTGSTINECAAALLGTWASKRAARASGSLGGVAVYGLAWARSSRRASESRK